MRNSDIWTLIIGILYCLSENSFGVSNLQSLVIFTPFSLEKLIWTTFSDEYLKQTCLVDPTILKEPYIIFIPDTKVPAKRRLFGRRGEIEFRMRFG